MEWARENPEAYRQIAALPMSEQNAALRAAIGFDPDAIRERAEEAERARIHCHRQLSPGLVESQGETASRGCESVPPLKVPPAGSLTRFNRSGAECWNCGAPEGVACQPWCRSEQVS